jgi:lipopolysaccharide export system permease protein
MKKIIYKQIAKDCTKFFFLTIFTISIIIWVLQAVNYLDFVIEDGHGFLVYFNYTLLSFPKIISRIFPFAIFITFSYILLKYENKNELIIFWNFGINKINFVNFFLKLSFFFILLSLLLSAIITPAAQDKARSFIRSSDLDFFESILKPKKFIDIVKNLTIYFNEKTETDELKNILLNDQQNISESQITIAKTGRLKSRDGKKILVLYDGKTINDKNGKISEFEFAKTDFNITRFGSNSITSQKTQENSTLELISCVLIFKNNEKNKENKEIRKINNCLYKNLENIYEELYSRLIKPIYIIFLTLIALLLILKSKSDHMFKFYKFKIYFSGFVTIILIESSSKFINTNMLQNLITSLLPIILILVIYIYFLNKLRVKKI